MCNKNLCLIHIVTMVNLLLTSTKNSFHCILSLEFNLILSHQKERISNFRSFTKGSFVTFLIFVSALELIIINYVSILLVQ